jgi:dinuclear metal center YbgI/SA1388 family protein
MNIKEILNYLETWAPPALQEEYDNTGLLSGDPDANCTGILCTLDVTEKVIDEAIGKNCNLIVAHHPIIFRPLKKLNGITYVERVIIKAIKNDIAVYAIHTNLDNIIGGVNAAIANALGLMSTGLSILAPKSATLSKLYTYVPQTHLENVKKAIFDAGAGAIGRYEECSFCTTGTGTFKPLPGSEPFIGTAGGMREEVPEAKLEFIFPSYLKQKILNSLFQSHPYEEVAYEIIKLENTDQYTGSGMLGQLESPVTETEFLQLVKRSFNVTAIKHTPLLQKPIQKIALCGGAGSFLIKKAIAEGADVYLTADLKYHEYFDADGKILLVDIGHWESEQFTIDLLVNFLQGKIPTFAVLKTEVNTNPVHNFV